MLKVQLPEHGERDLLAADRERLHLDCGSLDERLMNVDLHVTISTTGSGAGSIALALECDAVLDELFARWQIAHFGASEFVETFAHLC